ncbi:MAG: hypothetical protein AAF556_00655 [Pseudomonadota bacterium]
MRAENPIYELTPLDQEPFNTADQARLNAAEAGWQTTLEALNLVLAAAKQPGTPDQVMLDTVSLAKSRIDSALAMMEHVQDVSDRAQLAETSKEQH